MSKLNDKYTEFINEVYNSGEMLKNKIGDREAFSKEELIDLSEALAAYGLILGQKDSMEEAINNIDTATKTK